MKTSDENRDIDTAKGVLMRAYYARVEHWSQDFADRMAKREWATEDAFRDAFLEETDCACIYTSDCYDTIYSSNSSESARYEMGDREVPIDDPLFLNVWAILCFRRDIEDHHLFPEWSEEEEVEE